MRCGLGLIADRRKEERKISNNFVIHIDRSWRGAELKKFSKKRAVAASIFFNGTAVRHWCWTTTSEDIHSSRLANSDSVRGARSLEKGEETSVGGGLVLTPVGLFWGVLCWLWGGCGGGEIPSVRDSALAERRYRINKMWNLRIV